MPDITVEFKCEGCGDVLHRWTQQTDGMLDVSRTYQLMHENRHPDYLICRKCQKTIVYDDGVCVQHDTSNGHVVITIGEDGIGYFKFDVPTMDNICNAWQKHRRG